ncbi:MAG: MiaB/RimO family radical SAM methylthiotransferase [Candidatus Gracilibacteria bacterium]|nr:MiaB/RimO family radical SAM methylthiotransferase [Candidatus Gracilibacteria bacterium]
MKKYFLQTFGCAMNQADSEKLNMILLQSGFIKASEWSKADIVVFNTCSVRQKGEDRVFGMINEVKKENKNRVQIGKSPITVGITGCMVRKTGLASKHLEGEIKRNRAKKIEIAKEQSAIFNNDDKLFPRSETIDFTLRIEDTKFLPLILTHIFKEPIGTDYKFDDYLKAKQLRENPSQASIIIQTGCDNYCSYCIVPYTRGKENSRSIEDIVSEAKEAVKAGAKEITLVGQNVNSYGKQWIDRKYWNEEKGKWNTNNSKLQITNYEKDNSNNNNIRNGKFAIEDGFKSPFRQLLEELDKIEGLDRIRFTSSNPHDMTQDILDAHFELDKTCNYLHFALQSGSDDMLKKMNRKHSYVDFKKMVNYLRSKDPSFGISTDIIVGFSGETEVMFNETLKAFEECQFDFTYNARYSVRPGTIAAKLYPDDISDTVKANRWHILNDKLLENISKRNNLMLDKVEEILISGEKDGYFFGRTRNFKEVFISKSIDSPLHSESLPLTSKEEIKEKQIKIGDLVKVKITGMDRYILTGELV